MGHSFASGFNMTVSALPSLTNTATAKLVRLANGEYTAESVMSDPQDALKLGLMKEPDGNYGILPPAPFSSVGLAQTSQTVLMSLQSLTLGGL